MGQIRAAEHVRVLCRERVLFSGWKGIYISRIPLDQRSRRRPRSRRAGSRVFWTGSRPQAGTSRSGRRGWWRRRRRSARWDRGHGPLDRGDRFRRDGAVDRGGGSGRFYIGHMSTPGTLRNEDAVKLLVHELRRRGLSGAAGARVGGPDGMREGVREGKEVAARGPPGESIPVRYVCGCTVR